LTESYNSGLTTLGKDKGFDFHRNLDVVKGTFGGLLKFPVILDIKFFFLCPQTIA